MSRLAPLALALACCACAGPSAQAPGADPDSIRTQASPPLVAGRASRLVGLPVPAHPTVSVRLFFVSGAVDDPPGKEGLTALTATLMAEGGTVKLGAGELSEALYPMAAELSAVTDKETTVFAGRCPKGALERFLPILEDVVREPRFDPGEFERLRTRAIDAIEKGVRTEDDEELAKQALSLALHRGHPYGHFTGGTVEALRALTLDDVKAHWRRVFVVARLTIGAAGGYEGDLPARIERDLSALPRGSARPPLPAPVTRAPRFLLVEKKTTPTAISMGFTWEVKRGDRLFAVRAALREVDRWARRGLSQDELDRVKRFLAGYTLSFDVTDTRRLGYALDDAFYGLARPWLETLRSRLPSLTLEEVNGALRRHVDPARLRMVIVTHGAAELASEIRSGAPSPITYPVPKAAEVLEADRVIERFPLGVTGPEDVKVVKVEELFER